MKFTVNGRDYELLNALELDGEVAMGLKRHIGVGLGVLQRRLEEMDKLALDDDDEPYVLTPEDMKSGKEADPAALFESEKHLKAMYGLFWASRRVAGDPVTFEQSCRDIKLKDLKDMFESSGIEVQPEGNPTSPRSGTGVAARSRTATPQSRKGSTYSTIIKGTSTNA